MYEVSIKQERDKGGYNTTEEVKITVNNVEDIETIIGLFADFAKIIITKTKEDN